MSNRNGNSVALLFALVLVAGLFILFDKSLLSTLVRPAIESRTAVACCCNDSSSGATAGDGSTSPPDDNGSQVPTSDTPSPRSKTLAPAPATPSHRVVDLMTIQHIVLNVPTQTARKAHAIAQLTSLGVPHSHISVMSSIPLDQVPDHRRNGAMSMARVLYSKLVSDGEFQPFAVFEDDMAVHEPVRTISFPNDADVVYLGLSKCGVQPVAPAHTIPPVLTIVKDPQFSHLVRVHNMLSMHGMMYVSRRGVSAVYTALIESVLRFPEVPVWDITIARIQTNPNTATFYGLRRPLVYQTIQFNGQEEPTRFNVDSDMDGKKNTVVPTIVPIILWYD